MARLIKAKDWSATPLGPISTWPQSLRTTVSLVQASSSPIALAWGPGHTQIYNDGYWPICGAKHPTAMGQDFRECWASTFPVIGEAYERAWAGQSGYLEKMRMFLDRYGFLEEAWFTFSFSPIADESGGIGGLFHPITELTGQILSERRTRTLRDLAVHTANATTAEQALQLAAEVLQDANLDIPFAIFYLLDDEASLARRVAIAGLPTAIAGPELVELGEAGSAIARVTPWSIRDAVRGHRSVLLDVAGRLGDQVGPYPELPSRAIVLPIAQTGSATPVAVVVAGVSARLTLSDAYHVFYDLLGGAVATSLANARTLEQTRHKAEELAELDRAKTTFFGNVSHELRTPLTLILGPLEDELGERSRLPAPRYKRLETVHRNATRLLKLVNTLLDFSRIEAGRLHATYEPVDLSIETAQLASVFRAAIENAGLTLGIDCPPLPAAVHIDREMWEKIVLNLLSNAFKHTATGGINVELRWHGDHVALRVIDTGIGITAGELPRLFERFHRVKGAWSRSHEGTGIGLALVRELARMLGGDVQATSIEGAGSVFTVTVKTGTSHLPADHLAGSAFRLGESGPVPLPQPSPATAFADEAAQWRTGPSPTNAPGDRATKPRVVWCDDNADMRAYVTKLLEGEFEVVAVADGAEALAAIRDQAPELVLSDVMMPNMDGFELLAALRGDARTRTLPVIVLSARAGEESSVGALDAGADDYLIKPFSARELVSRVRTHIALNDTRRKWARQLEQANQELEAFGYSVSHDLRAPLRAVDAFTQILLADHVGGLDPKGVDYLKRILASARRMSAIIDDLLALSQIGRGELRLTTIDLTPIVCSIVAELRARTPGRRVEVTVADDLIAVCDPRLVTIALENLLANAWKFTSKLASPMIIVGREPGRDASDVLYVRDNGVGFDMRHADHLFEPFRRLHAETEFEGTGIGLAIVRRVIERHGGRVWAHGAVNEGATIRFTLHGASEPRRE